MVKRTPAQPEKPARTIKPAARRPSKLLDTRVIYCGDNLDELAKLKAGCIDLIYVDPPFNSASGLPDALQRYVEALVASCVR